MVFSLFEQTQKIPQNHRTIPLNMVTCLIRFTMSIFSKTDNQTQKQTQIIKFLVVESQTGISALDYCIITKSTLNYDLLITNRIKLYKFTAVIIQAHWCKGKGGAEHAGEQCSILVTTGLFLVLLIYMQAIIIIFLLLSPFYTSATYSFKFFGFKINSKVSHLIFHLCFVKPYWKLICLFVWCWRFRRFQQYFSFITPFPV